MPETTSQSYAHHTRYDPAFHFVLAPISLTAIVLSIVIMVRQPGLGAALGILLSLGLFLAAATLRRYSLQVQDRVIRLEERLRLAALLPASAQPRINELTVRQMVALRFASDGEAGALAMRAVQENMSGKQIKAAIQSWRPDHFRV